MTKRKPSWYSSQAQLRYGSTSFTTPTTPLDQKSPKSNCICRNCAVEIDDTQQRTFYPQLPRPVDPCTSPTGKLEPQTPFLRAFYHDLTICRPLGILVTLIFVLLWAVPVWKTLVSPRVLHTLLTTFIGWSVPFRFVLSLSFASAQILWSTWMVVGVLPMLLVLVSGSLVAVALVLSLLVLVAFVMFIPLITLVLMIATHFRKLLFC